MGKELRVCKDQDLTCTYCNEPIVHGQEYLYDSTSDDYLGRRETHYYHIDCIKLAGIELFKYKVVDLDEL